MKTLSALVAAAIVLSAPARARTISINLYNSAGNADSNQLDTGELAGVIPVDGEHWNDIGFGNGTLSGAAAQKNQAVKDDGGDPAAATFVSTLGSGWVGYSGASLGSGTAGSRDLMNSYLSFDDPSDGDSPNDNGELQLTGIGAAFTTPGYDVIVYFDTDNANRTHTLTVTPTGAPAIVRVGDDSGTYSGEFVQASGAGSYANYAVFENLNAASFSLAMASNVGRAAVSGIQIVSNDHPQQPEVIAFAAGDYYVTPGTDVTLSWETAGAEMLVLEPGGIDLLPLSTDGNGFVTVNVSATTTYSISATNVAGTVSAELRVGAGAAKPNILFFLVDDMGWQDTSEPFHYGTDGNAIVSALNDRYRTPSMEALAAKGRKFTAAYACSVCTPTRASIMTGMNSARHHITTWTHPATPQDTGSNQQPDLGAPAGWRRAGMDAGDIALPAMLQDAGYRTIHAGKAHFGSNGHFAGDPRAIGFDVNIAGHGAGGPGSYRGTDNFGTGIWHIPGLEQYHGQDIFLTEALTLEMNKAIESSVADGVPFFAYMAHYAVHGPFMEDPRFAGNYPSLSGNQKAFATLIEGMDKSLGDIMAKIDALGVAEDTLVIFLSDNGGDMTNTPLRAKKGYRYEGGMRVPMIVGWAKPDGTNSFQQTLPIAAGSREDDVVACWDMFPTVAGVAGASYTHDIDGHDLRPYFTGQPGVHRPQEFLMHFPHPHNHDFFTVLRDGDWKLIHNYGGQGYELYNLADDISETNNRASAEPERVMAMARKMSQQLDGMGAQYPRVVGDNSDRTPLMPSDLTIDLDADGLPDNSEDTNRNGLVDPGETDPDSDNTDGDNIDDGSEERIGLDPLDAGSFFYLRSVLHTDGTLEGFWPSAPGVTFRVESSGGLVDWPTTLAVGYPASAGTETSFDLGPIGLGRRFFRVALEP